MRHLLLLAWVVLSVETFHAQPFSSKELITNDTLQYASITFDSTVLHKDFKKPTEGNKTGVFEFNFTNTGNSPLLIYTSKASCGCTGASHPKEPVLPHQKGIIKVEYDLSRTGPFRKTVTVESNSKENPVTVLYIEGTTFE